MANDVLNLSKVTALPATLASDHVYLVLAAGKLSLVATDKNSTPTAYTLQGGGGGSDVPHPFMFLGD